MLSTVLERSCRAMLDSLRCKHKTNQHFKDKKTGKIIATTPSQALYLHSSHNETFTLVLYVQQTIDWGVCPWQDVVTICASVDFE